jgi:hypothetical protein
MSEHHHSPADERCIRKGAAEWQAKHKDRDFSGWMLIGASLAIGRRRALVEAGTNQPLGSAYNRAFAAWCQKYGFGDMDSATRSNLLYLQEPENRMLCDQIRATMATNERMRVAHPAAMVRRIRARKRELEGAPAKPPTMTPLARIQAEKDTLEQRLADTEERLAAAENTPRRAFDDFDTPEKIVQALIDLELELPKLRAVHHLLGQAIAAKPATKAKRKPPVSTASAIRQVRSSAPPGAPNPGRRSVRGRSPSELL